MIDVCRSLQRISERFAEKAEEMLKTEHDEEHVKALKIDCCYSTPNSI